MWRGEKRGKGREKREERKEKMLIVELDKIVSSGATFSLRTRAN